MSFRAAQAHCDEFKGPILTIWNASMKTQSASNFVGGTPVSLLFAGGINDFAPDANVKGVATLLMGVVWA